MDSNDSGPISVRPTMSGDISKRLTKVLERMDSCVEENRLAIEKIEAGIARRAAKYGHLRPQEDRKRSCEEGQSNPKEWIERKTREQDNLRRELKLANEEVKRLTEQLNAGGRVGGVPKLDKLPGEDQETYRKRYAAHYKRHTDKQKRLDAADGKEHLTPFRNVLAKIANNVRVLGGPTRKVQIEDACGMIGSTYQARRLETFDPSDPDQVAIYFTVEGAPPENLNKTKPKTKRQKVSTD